MAADAAAMRRSFSLPAFEGLQRSFFAAALTLLLCLPCLEARAADNGFICPDGRKIFLPGPDNSQIARIFAPLANNLERIFNGRVEITHRAGRGGAYVLRDLVRAKKDGCTQAGLVLPSLFYQEAGKDALIARGEVSLSVIAAAAANALWVADDSPHATWADFLAQAKRARNNSLEVFFIAGTGSYTDQHMATLQLNRQAGIQAQYAPLLGSAEAGEAVRRGTASACWGYALPPDSMPGLRPLAVAAARRSPALPDTPTFGELGIDFVNMAHFAFGIPAAVPAERLAFLRASIGNARAGVPPLEPGLEALALDPEQLAELAGQLQGLAEADLDEYSLLPAVSPGLVAP